MTNLKRRQLTNVTDELESILADDRVRAKLQAQPHPYCAPSWRGAANVSLYTYASQMLATGGFSARADALARVRLYAAGGAT